MALFRAFATARTRAAASFQPLHGLIALNPKDLELLEQPGLNLIKPPQPPGIRHSLLKQEHFDSSDRVEVFIKVPCEPNELGEILTRKYRLATKQAVSSRVPAAPRLTLD
jgi:hypothetical protein